MFTSSVAPACASSLAGGLAQGRLAWRPALAVGGSILLAGALAAAQLLPTVEYVLQTERAGGLPFEAVAAEYGAEEVMIVTITHDHEARRRSYELIAQAW